MPEEITLREHLIKISRRFQKKLTKQQRAERASHAAKARWKKKKTKGKP